MKDRTKLQYLLTDLLPELDQESIDLIYASGKQIDLQTGEYLFYQGEEKNNMYFVLRGRLRAISEKEGERTILGDITAGETVGELAFFTGEPRMASVRAIRHCIVLEFTPEQYMSFLISHPNVAHALFKLVISRLRRNEIEKNKLPPPKNVALIILQPIEGFEQLAEKMHGYFAQFDQELRFYDASSAKDSERDVFFENLDEYSGMNLLICDASDPDWVNKCVIYSDLVVVATRFREDPAIHPIENSLELYDVSVLTKKRYLLLIHDPQDPMPKNTARWLKVRKVDLHIHLRLGHQADIERFCRILSNRATGLVLGGGGAKGFAHIGVVKALLEAGIPIDFLGGTSAGALYGIGMAFADFDFTKIYQLNEAAVRRKLTSGDFTLPVLSLMTGKKFSAYLREMYEDYEMEDIWINTYCISTNLSKAEQTIHKTGRIWKQVFASMAIPGVFPPVIIEKNLHVDGGVMDNLPIEPMYSYPVGNIISVSLQNLEVKAFNYEKMPTPWSLFRDMFRKKKKYHVPRIASIITHSIIINSTQKQQETKNKVSHYIELDLKGVKMLDDKNWKKIAQKGYEQTKKYLQETKWKK